MLDPSGPWIFASVALVLVALLGWQLGRWAGQREGRAQMRSRPSAASRTAGKLANKVPEQAEVQAAEPTSEVATARQAAAQTPTETSAALKLDASEAAAFGYALSHDLRAPLRVVEGFGRILKEDYGRQLDRIGNDHLDRLLGAATRMHTMIEGMLSLAQLLHAPLKREPVNLSQLASFIIEDLRRSQAPRAVIVHIEPDLQAQGDPTLLRQLLENLLGNAWKYSQRANPAHIGFAARPLDRGMVYEVSDNGAGFDMRSAGKLFGLFQRLHGQSDFPGTGLGLASVARIVQRHGGDVWAEAEPGLGARFYFTLTGSPNLPPPG